jgi:hypothetical protein
MNTEIKVIRTCRETNKKEQVSMDYALEKLGGWYIKSEIEQMLLLGHLLYTPYAYYEIEKEANQ